MEEKTGRLVDIFQDPRQDGSDGLLADVVREIMELDIAIARLRVGEDRFLEERLRVVESLEATGKSWGDEMINYFTSTRFSSNGKNGNGKLKK